MRFLLPEGNHFVYLTLTRQPKCVFLSLFITYPLSHSLPILSHTLSLFPFLTLTLSLSSYLTLFISLLHTHSLPISLFFYLTLFLSLILSHSLPLSLFKTLTLSLLLTLSQSLSSSLCSKSIHTIFFSVSIFDPAQSVTFLSPSFLKLIINAGKFSLYPLICDLAACLALSLSFPLSLSPFAMCYLPTSVFLPFIWDFFQPSS